MSHSHDIGHDLRALLGMSGNLRMKKILTVTCRNRAHVAEMGAKTDPHFGQPG
jgi:hypothetical protein